MPGRRATSYWTAVSCGSRADRVGRLARIFGVPPLGSKISPVIRTVMCLLPDVIW